MADQKKSRILVVDDESSIRESLAGYLDDFDHDVTVAESAEDALALLEDRPYDLAIIDLRLPGMSGDTLILEANARYRAMRFLIHTGSVDYKLSDELHQIGMTAEHVFLKPLTDLRPLVTMVASLLTAPQDDDG